ncbi:MAG TPA: lysylphosphatidylglycerol synthase domain-containing protein [Polyangiaceae bacterium]|jgi:hypothetical protein|nr:lysylphosphatidylglycerol synthase domain-containing protein [Polyangiaceae bacterium]
MKRKWGLVLHLFLGCAGAALLVRAFAGLDWSATLRAIASAGPVVLVALVPFGVAIAFDALACNSLSGLRVADLFVVRVITEALHFGAPGGVVASEAAAIALYTKRLGLGAKTATALAVRRKQLVMRSHAVYLALGALVSSSALVAFHPRAPLFVLGSAAIPLALSFAVGACFDRVTSTRQLPAPRATVFFFCAWLSEALETAVIAHVVGARLSVPAVIAVECAISLTRSAVAFVPGGLGVQDLGYTTALAALGVPHETAAAFALMKRAKEVAWIAAGFAVSSLIRDRRTNGSVPPLSIGTPGAWPSASAPSSGASPG